MRRKQLRAKQDELRRANKAYIELATIGGYFEQLDKLFSIQHLTISVIALIDERIAETLERANLKTNRTISTQNALLKASEGYFKFFEGAMGKESIIDWANDLDKLEEVLYQFANIKTLRPKRKAMSEAKALIEEKYGVELEDLK